MKDRIYLTDDVVSRVSWGYEVEKTNEKGNFRMPSEAYQLVINGLEMCKYDATGADRDTIKMAISICEMLRDKEKMVCMKEEG